ncbi:RNA-directed DNA polymerase, eukaryota, reverse transcriptase zinc-binding domain protein [Tanacetum coccineum]
MQVYRALVFAIPKTVIKDINKLLKGLLWCQGELVKGMAKVAWESICRPKDKGGLGLKNLQAWNETLLMKHLWNVAAKKDTLWVKWISVEKLKGTNLWDIPIEKNYSQLWKTLLGRRDNIGDMYDARMTDNCKVANAIEGNDWKWPSDWYVKYPMLENMEKLLTQDIILKWKPNEILECVLCGKYSDFLEHLFFQCTYFSTVWGKLQPMINWKAPQIWKDNVEELDKLKCHNNIWSIFRILVYGAAVYFIAKKEETILFKEIVETVTMKFMSLQVKESKAVENVELEWYIKLQRVTQRLAV